MSGIIPNSEDGAVTVRDVDGNPIAQDDVEFAHIPNADFGFTCALNYFPSGSCNVRIWPKQINAFQSELLCLAETLSPNGQWNCTSVCNLSKAFTEWKSGPDFSQAVVGNICKVSQGDAAGDALLLNCNNGMPQLSKASQIVNNIIDSVLCGKGAGDISDQSGFVTCNNGETVKISPEKIGAYTVSYLLKTGNIQGTDTLDGFFVRVFDGDNKTQGRFIAKADAQSALLCDLSQYSKENDEINAIIACTNNGPRYVDFQSFADLVLSTICGKEAVETAPSGSSSIICTPDGLKLLKIPIECIPAFNDASTWGNADPSTWEGAVLSQPNVNENVDITIPVTEGTPPFTFTSNKIYETAINNNFTVADGTIKGAPKSVFPVQWRFDIKNECGETTAVVAIQPKALQGEPPSYNGVTDSASQNVFYDEGEVIDEVFAIESDSYLEYLDTSLQPIAQYFKFDPATNQLGFHGTPENSADWSYKQASFANATSTLALNLTFMEDPTFVEKNRMYVSVDMSPEDDSTKFGMQVKAGAVLLVTVKIASISDYNNTASPVADVTTSNLNKCSLLETQEYDDYRVVKLQVDQDAGAPDDVRFTVSSGGFSKEIRMVPEGSEEGSSLSGKCSDNVVFYRDGDTTVNDMQRYIYVRENAYNVIEYSQNPNYYNGYPMSFSVEGPDADKFQIQQISKNAIEFTPLSGAGRYTLNVVRSVTCGDGSVSETTDIVRIKVIPAA